MASRGRPPAWGVVMAGGTAKRGTKRKKNQTPGSRTGDRNTTWCTCGDSRKHGCQDLIKGGRLKTGMESKSSLVCGGETRSRSKGME